MRCHLLYVHDTAIGYGRYGVKLAAALQTAGVDVSDRLDADHPDPRHLVCWVSTPTHATGWFEQQRTVISTMWETTTLPEGFREALHNHAQILVPSDHNLELFSKYHPNVTKVPLGVDPEWHFRARQEPSDRFVFLIGGSGPRKGTDLAWKAFQKLWGNEGSWPSDMPRPTLIFKSPRAIDWAHPRVEWVGGKIPDEAERDLYGMAHCYLQPSRGEGWGLQPLQAIAQGVPTILTDAHGQHEFADLGLPISAGYSASDYFIHGDAGQWWEPSLDELCERMEWVYFNWGQAAAQAERNSRAAHDRFSWERCAQAWIEAVGPEHLETGYQGSGRWVKPEYKRYLTRVTRPWRAEVAQTVYQFQPGRDYHELADVKRLLWEAGVLDPSCAFKVDPDNPDAPLVADVESGLTDAQLAEAGAYSASHGHCTECGQILGSGVRYEPTFDDDRVPA